MSPRIVLDPTGEVCRPVAKYAVAQAHPGRTGTYHGKECFAM